MIHYLNHVAKSCYKKALHYKIQQIKFQCILISIVIFFAFHMAGQVYPVKNHH